MSSETYQATGQSDGGWVSKDGKYYNGRLLLLGKTISLGFDDEQSMAQFEAAKGQQVTVAGVPRFFNNGEMKVAVKQMQVGEHRRQAA
ncbi:MAG: hypothetical protein MI757_05635 [Pirellulales bacterium]|nr:hypothetical protein [Pirellulales bacterium]